MRSGMEAVQQCKAMLRYENASAPGQVGGGRFDFLEVKSNGNLS